MYFNWRQNRGKVRLLRWLAGLVSDLGSAARTACTPHYRTRWRTSGTAYFVCAVCALICLGISADCADITETKGVAGVTVQTGIASWYGPDFNGRMAASGEPFDMEQLTAAHRTLPFGTLVKVRRLDTDRSTVVRINDRGPFFGARIIDLSLAAARSLGMSAQGLAMVALEVLDAPEVDPEARFGVQIGAFRVPQNAARAVANMRRLYGAAQTIMRHREEDFSTVVVGEFPSEAEAGAFAQKLRAQEAPVVGAFVVRIDPPAAAVSQ